MPNLILRFHFKARLPASVFFFLTIVLLWFAQLDLCAALMESGLGITPMQVRLKGASCLLQAGSFLPAASSLRGRWEAGAALTRCILPHTRAPADLGVAQLPLPVPHTEL